MGDRGREDEGDDPLDTYMLEIEEKKAAELELTKRRTKRRMGKTSKQAKREKQGELMQANLIETAAQPIAEENIGRKLLSKFGYTRGGLGEKEDGITVRFPFSILHNI